MKELRKALKEIENILYDSAKNDERFDEVLGKLSKVKVHGVVFPTLMLMEIIDNFTRTYVSEAKASLIKDFDEKEMDNKFRQVQMNWNNKDTIN